MYIQVDFFYPFYHLPRYLLSFYSGWGIELLNSLKRFLFFSFFHPQFPLCHVMYSCVHFFPLKFSDSSSVKYIGNQIYIAKKSSLFLDLKKYFASIVLLKWCCLSGGVFPISWNMNRWHLGCEGKYYDSSVWFRRSALPLKLTEYQSYDTKSINEYSCLGK
jgi:hypothetical protein